MELTDAEIQQLKEQNHNRIKRIVSIVAMILIIVSIILIALSLSLGPKIDQLGLIILKLEFFKKNYHKIKFIHFIFSQ